MHFITYSSFKVDLTMIVDLEICNSVVDPILVERTLTGTHNILLEEDFLNELIKVTYCN